MKRSIVPIVMPPGVSLAPGFACTHCGSRRSLFRSARSARQHVAHCIRNPAQRSCATCLHDFRDEDGSRCERDVRPEGERLVRMCSEWSPCGGEESQVL